MCVCMCVFEFILVTYWGLFPGKKQLYQGRMLLWEPKSGPDAAECHF